MPFMSYQVSKEEAIKNTWRFIKETEYQAVKIDRTYIEEIKDIVNTGIPYVGYLGLIPLSVNSMGGYRVQGKSVISNGRMENWSSRLGIAAQKLIEDCLKLKEAGCFAIALECVPRRSSSYY